MIKKTLLIAGLAFLAACSSDPLPAVKVESDPAAKINLDVAGITVLDRSSPSLSDSPYATNNFQPTLLAATRQWAAQKLAAVGTSGQATFVIKDASLKVQPLAYEETLFDRQQASKYIAHVEVQIDIASPRAGQGRVMAEASRYETLPEDPTAIERQNAYTKVLNGLMRDLSAKLRDGIQTHITPFVITAPILDGKK